MTKEYYNSDAYRGGQELNRYLFASYDPAMVFKYDEKTDRLIPLDKTDFDFKNRVYITMFKTQILGWIPKISFPDSYLIKFELDPKSEGALIDTLTILWHNITTKPK